MQYKDYYKILGVERKATQDDIKKAFRRLAAKYHPDRNKEAGAEERFKEINEAHEVLGDADKRSQYDQLGADWHAGDDFRPPPGWAGNTGRSTHFDASFFEDIARQSGSGASPGFSDFFESLFGANFRRGGPRPNARHGKNTQHSQTQVANIQLDIEDIYHGAAKTIRLPSGDNVQVRIPAGIREGKKIRLSGKGPHGSDVHLQVGLKEHPLYRTEGDDIYMDIPLTPWEAALGATISIPTLGGKINLKVPAGSQSGKKMRLKGRGLPGKQPGDFYVVLNIHTPPAETAEQKAYYEQMRKLFDWDPRRHMA